MERPPPAPSPRTPDEPLARIRAEEERARRAALLGAWLGQGTPARTGLRAYVGAMVIVAVCSAIAAVMNLHFELSNLTMVYLVGVVVAAIAFGRGPAIATAVASVAVFDWMFVPPRFKFEVGDTQYLVTFGVMLVVAVVTGTLTAWLRQQVQVARLRETRTAALYRLSHDLAARSTVAEVIETAAARIAEVLDSNVAFLVPDPPGRPRMIGSDAALVDERERELAERALENGEPIGLDLFGAGGSGVLHWPLRAGIRNVGVLSIRLPPSRAFADPERLALLRALASQTALALERCRLSQDVNRASLQIETERARSALLSSVSHDLRTPLAAIAGAASSLREPSASLSEAVRRELLDTIWEEAERLNRLIANLLEMTRLESGALRARKEWHPLEEVVGAALLRLETSLGDRAVRIVLAGDLPLVPIDDVLFEQLVWNLVENANKYAPAGEPIEITATVGAGELRFEVADRGPGLAPGEELRVFDKFYRGSRAGLRPGAGLGLAIAQAIAQAHGGTIAAANRKGGGAVFTVRLPLAGDPPAVEREPLDLEA